MKTLANILTKIDFKLTDERPWYKQVVSGSLMAIFGLVYLALIFIGCGIAWLLFLLAWDNVSSWHELIYSGFKFLLFVVIFCIVIFGAAFLAEWSKRK